MDKSESIVELATALGEAQAEFEVIGKNKINPYYTSTYADLPAVVGGSRTICLDHGLVVTQFPDFDGQFDLLTTLVVHVPSGEWLCASMRLYNPKQDAQGLVASITYGRRAAYTSSLGLVVADEDDDGNGAVYSPNKESEPPVNRQGQYAAPTVQEQVGKVAEQARTARAGSARGTSGGQPTQVPNEPPKVSKNPDGNLTEAQGRAIWGVATKGLEISEVELAQLVLQRDVELKTDSKGHKVLQVTKAEASKIIETGKEWERDGIPAEFLGLDEPAEDQEPF